MNKRDKIILCIFTSIPIAFFLWMFWIGAHLSQDEKLAMHKSPDNQWAWTEEERKEYSKPSKPIDPDSTYREQWAHRYKQ